MLKKVLYVLGGILLVGFLVNLCSGESKKGTTASDSTQTSTSTSSSTSSQEDSKYTYSEKVDEMTDGKVKLASITSDNTIELEFPYGDCALTYTIRKSSKGDNDVFLRISSGQFIGNEFTGDNYVMVRFDSLPATKYFFVNASDGSTDVVFLKNVKDFIAKAKQAKEVKIEATLFDAGSRLFRFSTPQPLVWD